MYTKYFLLAFSMGVISILSNEHLLQLLFCATNWQIDAMQLDRVYETAQYYYIRDSFIVVFKQVAIW